MNSELALPEGALALQLGQDLGARRGIRHAQVRSRPADDFVATEPEQFQEGVIDGNERSFGHRRQRQRKR
jgi:hypothetical protein